MPNKHYKKILKGTEREIKWVLNYQITDKCSSNFGAVINQNTGYCSAREAGKYFDVLISVYYNQDSIYYQEEEILQRANNILNYLIKIQNANGTLDLKDSNYNSAPGTAFNIQVVARTYRLIVKYNFETNMENKVKNNLYNFIKKSGEGIYNGGFHTPNHRWVIAAALALIYQITDKIKYKNMAKRYLKEGIDINEDGEYTERSAGGYDAVVDKSLLIITEELDKPDLMNYIIKNLNYIIKLIQPDNSIYTGNSKRYDSNIRRKLNLYYEIFLLMAYKTREPVYSYIVDDIYSSTNIMDEDKNKNLLALFMLKEGLKKYEPKNTSKYPQNFEMWFKKTGLIRIRRNDTSVSITQNNSAFLEYQKGKTRMAVKMCSSFFSRGQFKAQKIKKTNNGYRLLFEVKYGYIRPFKKNESNTGKWHKMKHGDWQSIKKFNTRELMPDWEEINHGKRDITNIQKVKFVIDIYEKNGNLELHMHSQGVEGVLYKLEFILDSGGILETPGTFYKSSSGDSIIIKEGYCIYKNKLDKIKFGPGFASHVFADNMRGSDSQSEQGFTVYFTGETPLNRKIEVMSR